MRLCKYANGTFVLLAQDVAGCLRVQDLETMMSKYVHDDGTISALCVDFAGQYIPLKHREEISLVARMVAQFHNQHINENPEVRTI